MYVKDIEIVVNQSLVGKVYPCGLVSNIRCVDPDGRIFFIILGFVDGYNPFFDKRQNLNRTASGVQWVRDNDYN